MVTVRDSVGMGLGRGASLMRNYLSFTETIVVSRFVEIYLVPFRNVSPLVYCNTIYHLGLKQ